MSIDAGLDPVLTGRVAATVGTVLLTCACTGPTAAAPAPGATGRGSASPAASAAGRDATGTADAAAFERALQLRLTLPVLPSFSLPTDLVASHRDSDIAGRLALQPGLYAGIAVVGARCGADGTPRAADSGVPLAGRAGAGTYKDATRTITVGGDGTGVYDAPGLHVAVLAGGTGVVADGNVRLTVQPGGAGTYVAGGRRLNVRADGSGSFSDGVVRLHVSPDGAAGYDDASTHVSLDGGGHVTATGDPGRVAVVVRVLRKRLPRFAPVPRVSRVTERGPACGTIIRLDANVLFDFDASKLRPASTALLARVATLLRALGSPKATVTGFTDSVGSSAYNISLSRSRADAVRDELVRRGVAGGSLVPRGLGEAQPVRPDIGADGRDDPAARQLNRRVELLLAD